MEGREKTESPGDDLHRPGKGIPDFAERKAHRCRATNAMNSTKPQSRRSVQRLVRAQNHVKRLSVSHSHKQLQVAKHRKRANSKMRCDKLDVTGELQARRGHGSAEPKPFASSRACRPFDSLRVAYISGRRAYRAGKLLGANPHPRPKGNRSFHEWGEWIRGWICASKRISNLERIKSGPNRKTTLWRTC